jgi:hypothetical protein
MIIDKIQLAGPETYFKDPANPGQINLAGQVTSRTKPLGKGEQLEISAIEMLIEADGDLRDLLNFQSSPLLSITVMKEMFPALFAEPFRHRVHNISGFEDFKRGALQNAKVMDIDGVPTIVSIGTGICKWTSPLYPVPAPVTLNHASWELAASRKTPPENFKYSLKLSTFDVGQNLIQTLYLTNFLNPAQPGDLDPTKRRNAINFDLRNVRFYQIEFSADVRRDTSLYEKHSTVIGESIGTPLLRAVNLLEAVDSIYDVYSLQELLSRSSDYHLFEFQGQPIKKMLVSLDLSATLVHSEYQTIANSDPNDPNSLYEFVEISVLTDKFSNIEARVIGETLVRPVVR